MSGAQLGRYEVLQSLSTSGTAELLLARTTGMQSFERHVVIKRIRAELAGDERFVQSFLDEARLAASLHHQNIVQVYDVGEQDGAYFFAMEYVHGEDLRRLASHVREQAQQVPLAVVVAIVSAAAAGLHHAHEKLGPDREPLRIVHRDVSPGNILVGYDGSVKLVDFGLAKAVMRTVATRAGRLKGKAAYMSPEQCTGRELDRRSDVFGLGIVLYELATTRRLFKAANDFLAMSAIVTGEVPPPSTHRADLPRELDEIVLRALAKSPEARYPNAEALRAALEQLAVSRGLRTSPKALADYMRDVFGERAEPWRVDAVHAARPRVDDGANVGIVKPPSFPESLVQGSLDTSPLALAQAAIEITRTEADGDQFVAEDATIATPPPDFPSDDTGYVRGARLTTSRTVVDDTHPGDTTATGGRPALEHDGSTVTAQVLSARDVQLVQDEALPDDEMSTLRPSPPRARNTDEVSTLIAPLPQVAALAAQARDPRVADSPAHAAFMSEPSAPTPLGVASMSTGTATPAYDAPLAPSWRTVLRENPALAIAGVAALGIVVLLAVLLLARHG